MSPVHLIVVLLVLTPLWFLPMYVAHEIGAPKHRNGFLWGLFLGWIGVIVVALLPPKPKYVDPKPTKSVKFFSKES